jgi:hypothetical protein
MNAEKLADKAILGACAGAFLFGSLSPAVALIGTIATMIANVLLYKKGRDKQND